MHRRFLGAFRDLWWLLLPFLGAAIVFWLIGWPGITIWLAVILLATYAFFAVVRYDDQGRERADGE